jgi:hypothetical protein
LFDPCYWLHQRASGSQAVSISLARKRTPLPERSRWLPPLGYRLDRQPKPLQLIRQLLRQNAIPKMPHCAADVGRGCQVDQVLRRRYQIGGKVRDGWMEGIERRNMPSAVGLCVAENDLQSRIGSVQKKRSTSFREHNISPHIKISAEFRQ